MKGFQRRKNSKRNRKQSINHEINAYKRGEMSFEEEINFLSNRATMIQRQWFGSRRTMKTFWKPYFNHSGNKTRQYSSHVKRAVLRLIYPYYCQSQRIVVENMCEKTFFQECVKLPLREYLQMIRDMEDLDSFLVLFSFDYPTQFHNVNKLKKLLMSYQIVRVRQMLKCYLSFDKKEYRRLALESLSQIDPQKAFKLQNAIRQQEIIEISSSQEQQEQHLSLIQENNANSQENQNNLGTLLQQDQPAEQPNTPIRHYSRRTSERE